VACFDSASGLFRPVPKFAEPRPYANPDAAARKLIEIANSVEAVQDGRIFIELINGPMLFELKATPAEYSVGLKLAIERGWLVMHESGTYVKFTRAARSCSHDDQMRPLRGHWLGVRKPPGEALGWRPRLRLWRRRNALRAL
jgi:hypothetical protein